MITADTITDEQIRELRASVADIVEGPIRCSWRGCPFAGKHPRMDCLCGHYCTEHAQRIEHEQLAAGQASSFPSLLSVSDDEDIFETCCVALFGVPLRVHLQAEARARCAEILNARAKEI